MQFISRSALLFILFLLLTRHTFACLNNVTKTLKSNIRLYVKLYPSDLPGGYEFYKPAYYLPGIKKLDSLYAATKDPDYLSDKGLLLILQKQYTQAVDLYLNLEVQYPDRYATASNLGTAYELMGKNEQALKWIEKAVDLDPSSHFGSEWIHINILKAKIKGPAYYNSKFILNTDFGTDSLPITDLSQTELQVLHDALFYQLNERASFIKPKDTIMANLFFDLGNTALLLGKYKEAEFDYGAAYGFGYSREVTLMRTEKSYRWASKPQLRIQHLKNMPKKVPYLKYGFIAIGIAALFTIFLFLLRKKRNHNIALAYDEQ